MGTMTAKSTHHETKIIMQQIGNRAFMMMGARQFSYDSNKYANLSFRIGRNEKKVNHIEIVLNGLDLYDIKFNRIHGTSFKTISESNNVYFDMLHTVIEKIQECIYLYKKP